MPFSLLSEKVREGERKKAQAKAGWLFINPLCSAKIWSEATVCPFSSAQEQVEAAALLAKIQAAYEVAPPLPMMVYAYETTPPSFSSWVTTCLDYLHSEDSTEMGL